MSIKLAIRILHYTRDGHPDRTKWIEVIKHILQDRRVKVYLDSSGTPYSGLHNLYTDTLRYNPTHLLVLHHDILPSFNFVPTVEKCIHLLHNEPLTFYTNNTGVNEAMNKNKHWVKLRIWYYSQAFVMPFNLMKKMISWIDENVAEDERNSDDERMAMYFYYHNRYVYATAPSLVEHIGWNSTTVDYGRPLENYLEDRSHRMAAKFIGIDSDPLKVDWARGLTKPIYSNEDWALENSDKLFQKLLKPESKYKIK